MSHRDSMKIPMRGVVITKYVPFIIMSLRAVSCRTLRDDCGLHIPKYATVLMTQLAVPPSRSRVQVLLVLINISR